MKIKDKRPGFTLVELLIVIIIIGILSGAMLLIVSSGNESAEASRIVSDLRSLKAAVMLYYMENTDAAIPDVDPDLKKYMDRPPEGKYDIEEPVPGSLYVRYDLTGVASGIVNRLKKMNESGIEVTSGDTHVRMRAK